MHPDKGGDAERFRLLQEMKAVLLRGRCSRLKHNRQRAGAEAHDEVSDSGSEAGVRSKEQEELKGSEAAEVCSGVADRGMLELDRRKLQQELAELWGRCEQLGSEIDAQPGCASDGGKAVRHLSSFVNRFMPFELALLKDKGVDPCPALAVLGRFLQDGGEVLAAASAIDARATVSVVALQVNAPLLASAPSPELQRCCAALLEAIPRVPLVLRTHLLALVSTEAVAHGRRAAAAPAVPRAKEQEQPEHVEEPSGLATDASSAAEEEQQRQSEEPAESELGAQLRMQRSQSPRGLTVSEHMRRTAWDSDIVNDCIGRWRSDGSAVYCNACDCWVPMSDPFVFSGFARHCETDFMHSMAVGALD